MTKKPTLLQWLRSVPESRIKQLTGYNATDAYRLMEQINLFGLPAFDMLTSDVQYKILSQYVSIFRNT